MLDKLQAVYSRYEELCAKSEQPDFYNDPKKAAALLREKNDLEPIVECYLAYRKAQQDLVDAEELMGMLVDNSDEPYAREITRAVMNRRRKKLPIETTTQLKEVIEEALKFLPEKEYKETVKKSCQRTFQALRIDVNHEFEVLYTFLEKLPEVLAPGGRVAILTFHSGEDRLVKRSFKELQKAGIYSEVAADVIRPSAEECARNSRAKSTKMRWAIRAE